MRYLSIAFWAYGEKLMTVKSYLYPSYSVGDTIKLETNITDDGATRWNKSQDDISDVSVYEVERVEHYVKKVFDKKIIYKVRMDVYLSEKTI